MPIRFVLSPATRLPSAVAAMPRAAVRARLAARLAAPAALLRPTAFKPAAPAQLAVATAAVVTVAAAPEQQHATRAAEAAASEQPPAAGAAAGAEAADAADGPRTASIYTRRQLAIEDPQAFADVRSDTVTRPSPDMLQAMIAAPVGDDVFGEDPTINELERTVARLAGKEAALFCASGTMSNQVAIRSHLTQPPYSVLCDARAHVLNHEAGGIAFHCGAAVVAVPPREHTGHLTAALVKRHLITSTDIHTTPTRLVCLENTLNGSVMPIDDIRAISEFVRGKGIPIHLDGARLWNASAATGISIKDYCSHFDSVSLCFSKGGFNTPLCSQPGQCLGAPVGSVLVGSTEFIAKARHFRKLYGGAMRQAGILAAACLYALDHYFPTLSEVHANARYFGDALVALGFGLDRPVETNMVWLDTAPLGLVADDVAKVLLKARIRAFGGEDTVMRIVLHHQVSREDLERAVAELTVYVATLGPRRAA
ncbi:Threonine aldolase [Polyrhizophydium stewartii]|uniref:Threonine aldolase n=1 Tax=Polyrhizophydium stewartii TaxID=2732419 RepID=A0ABR4NHY5_9FUNG